MRGIMGLLASMSLCLLAACNPLYHPGGAPSPGSAARVGMDEVSYETADGLVLGGWYRAASGDLPTLIYFHGNSGHHGQRAGAVMAYLNAGYGVMLASYRGYGGNPGRPDEDGLYADGRAALTWLAGTGIAADRIVIFGESLGTGVAVQMAVDYPIAGLILQSPFTSTVDVGQEAVPLLPVGLLMTHRFDSLSKIDRLSAPLLLIHGEADRVVPSHFGRRLYAAAPAPKTAVFIPGAGHNDLHRFGVAETVLEFLASLPAGRAD